VTLVFAQLSHADSLRALETAFNATPISIIIWGSKVSRARRAVVGCERTTADRTAFPNLATLRRAPIGRPRRDGARDWCS